MKILSFFVFILAVPIVVLADDFRETSYLKVRQAQLKSEPSFLSKSTANLKYGDSLKILENKQNWFKVKNNTGITGYVHSSALSSNKIVFTSETKFTPKSASSADGIVMAGKGFNKQVEKKYAASNSQLNYRAVDQMEQIRVSDKQINSFVKAGDLK